MKMRGMTGAADGGPVALLNPITTRDGRLVAVPGRTTGVIRPEDAPPPANASLPRQMDAARLAAGRWAGFVRGLVGR